MMESVTRTHGSRAIQLAVVMTALLSVSAATSRTQESRKLVDDPLFMPDLSDYGAGKGKSTKTKSTKAKGAKSKSTKGPYVPYTPEAPHFAPAGVSWGTTEAPYPAPTGVSWGTTGKPYPVPTGGPVGTTEKPYPVPTGGPVGTTGKPYPVPTESPLGKGGPAPGKSKKGKDTKGKGDKGAPNYTPPTTPPAPTPDQKPAYPTPTSDQKPASPTPTSDQKPAYPTPTSDQKPAYPTPTTDQQPASPTPTPQQNPASPTPTPGQKPASPTPTPDDSVAGKGGLDCDAVQAGTAPTTGPSIKLRADLDVAIYTDNGMEVDELSNEVYAIMNDYVRYWFLGCEAPTPGRRLNEATMTNAIMDSTGASDTRTCTTSIKNAVCVALDTPTVSIYIDDGDTSTFQDRLNQAISKAIDDGLFMFDGVADVNIPGYTDRNISAQDDNGLSTPGKISIAVLSLALLLLALLFVRRRRSSQDESFVKHMDRNDLFLDDMTQDLNNARVLGDENSLEDDIFHGTYDESATLNPNDIGGSHAGMDVHVCQSSLCEACEQRKNGGIAFVKIGAPSSPPRIPDDASRDYSLSDTVLL